MQVKVISWIPKGQVFMMADYGHPEISMFELGDDVPEGRIIVCHPDDERRVRDALAVLQEFRED